MWKRNRFPRIRLDDHKGLFLQFPWNFPYANFCLFPSGVGWWSCKGPYSEQFQVCPRQRRSFAKHVAIAGMKRSVDEIIFSTLCQTGARYATDDTQIHIATNPDRPADRKSLTERHQTADYVDCRLRHSSSRYTRQVSMENFTSFTETIENEKAIVGTQVQTTVMCWADGQGMKAHLCSIKRGNWHRTLYIRICSQHVWTPTTCWTLWSQGFILN